MSVDNNQVLNFSLFLFQSQYSNITVILTLLFQAFWSFELIFISCELGERVCNAFDEIGDTIDQLDWYLLPFEMQQLLPTIILNTKQPVVLQCFGNILCCREVLRNVSRKWRQKYQFTAYKKQCVCERFYNFILDNFTGC